MQNLFKRYITLKVEGIENIEVGFEENAFYKRQLHTEIRQ